MTAPVIGTVAAMEAERAASTRSTDAIERLRTAVGDDAFGSIIDAYVDDAVNQLDALDRAITASDPDALAFSAHQLRSGSQLLGLDDLDAMAGALEQLGLAGSLDGAADIVVAMRVSHAEATTALRALRG